MTKSFVVFCHFDYVAGQRDVFHQFDVLCGYTATKKLGNAVVRNRVKRRLRAVVRDVVPYCPYLKGAGIVLVARHFAMTTPYEELCAEAYKVFNYLRKQK